MKMVKRLLIGILLLVAVLVGIAFLLPSQFNVARSATINAPAEKIYPLIATTRQYENRIRRPGIGHRREVVVGE